MVPLIEKKHRILRKCAMSLLGNNLLNFLDVLCSLPLTGRGVGRS